MLKIIVTILDIFVVIMYLVLLSKKNEQNVQIGCEFLLVLTIFNLIIIWGGK